MEKKELLESAAKAFGLQGYVWSELESAMVKSHMDHTRIRRNLTWDPTEINTQAFELLVHIGVRFMADTHGAQCESVFEPGKPLAASRMAITRAAAHFGSGI